MNAFLLYLLEASLVLVVLYGAYRLLLSKETFFAFNRFFLMGILVLSLLFPLLSFEIFNSEKSFINQQSTELGKARYSYHQTFEELSQGTLSQESSRWLQIGLKDWDVWQALVALTILIYVIGFSYRIFRLSLGYLKVYRLKKKLTSTDFDGLKVSEIPSHMAPFSFLNTVFIPDSIEDEREYSQILAHEKTHIQQRHSIDLIFVQIVAALLWFNPVVWLLLKSLKQTHEYIADKNMLKQGFSLVEYQSLLLRQLISNNSYGLVHNFNLSFIKKRITMMSIKESGWAGKSKIAMTVVLVSLIGVMTAQSNTVLDVPAMEEASTASYQPARDIKFYVDGVALSTGLQFSRVKGYKGEFKFEFDNRETDKIHLGLDLVRKGKVVGHASKKLRENASFTIKALLSKAQPDDYLVIDIIDGPSDAVKLYNLPLFREGEGFKKRIGNDLPPPPVELSINGTVVSAQKGISLTELKRQGNNVKLTYALSEFVDFGVLSKQAGNVKASLIRSEKAVLSILNTEIKRKDTIDIYELLKQAKKGDEIMVQFGKPDGLRFGAKFSIQ